MKNTSTNNILSGWKLTYKPVPNDQPLEQTTGTLVGEKPAAGITEKANPHKSRCAFSGFFSTAESDKNSGRQKQKRRSHRAY
jgi:hypothetical protein